MWSQQGNCNVCRGTIGENMEQTDAQVFAEADVLTDKAAGVNLNDFKDMLKSSKRKK